MVNPRSDWKIGQPHSTLCSKSKKRKRSNIQTSIFRSNIKFPRTDRNGQRGRLIGRVDGHGWALRRPEEAVCSIAAPGRAILRVFRCVIANARAWGLKTWSLDEHRDCRHGKPSGGQAFAATHPMFGAVDCHHICQACYIAHQSLPFRAKALGVVRWNSHQEVFMTRWESLAAV